MKTIKLAVLFLMITASFFTMEAAAAEKPNGPDRGDPEKTIFQIKKMKMLEELQLSDEQADKFIMTYNTWEKQINAARQKTDSARRDLDSIVHDTTHKYSNTQYSQKADNLLSCLNGMQDLIQKRNAAIKGIVDGETYAKYILFEENFMFNMQRKMMHSMRPGRGHDDDFDPNMPPPPDGKCMRHGNKGPHDSGDAIKGKEDSVK